MKYHLILVLIVGLFICPSRSVSANWEINANGFLGTNTYNEEFEWEVSSDLKKQSWPVSFAIGYSQFEDARPYSYDGGIPYVHQRFTREVNFGIKKLWKPTSVYRCFVDGGVAFVSLEEDWYQFIERDTSIGYWIGTGTFFEFFNVVNVGYEMRYSRVDLDLTHSRYESFHAGWLFGIHIEL